MRKRLTVAKYHAGLNKAEADYRKADRTNQRTFSAAVRELDREYDQKYRLIAKEWRRVDRLNWKTRRKTEEALAKGYYGFDALRPVKRSGDNG